MSHRHHRPAPRVPIERPYPIGLRIAPDFASVTITYSSTHDRDRAIHAAYVLNDRRVRADGPYTVVWE